jgi:prephenate dehydrogenase
MKVTIIGTGLIGGSMALCLKEKGLATYVTGVDANRENADQAIALGIADEFLPLKEAVEKSDVVIIAVPVAAATKVISEVLGMINQQVVFDVGSTKTELCRVVDAHPKRGRFVPTHPMWGTEFSGPGAATVNAFAGKATVICDREKSDRDALELVEDLYRTLGMHLVNMDAAHHDIHTAYVSHISHITSFALANTVLEKEKEEDAIFELASGGFESTVRLAKSNADMWVPIFMQNKENVLDVLNEHITQLRKFKASLEKENWDYLRELIEHANEIKRILK